MAVSKPVAQSKPTFTPTPTPTIVKITRVEVQRHNLETDCWSIISGYVYNLTALVIQHPGGTDPIKAVCGTDGTASFLGQHANQAEQAQELAKLRIGILD